MEANSNRISVIRKLCKLSQEKGSYDSAIKILEKEVDAASNDFGMEDRCELFERLAIFYHYTSEDGHRAKEFKAIRQCMELQGGQCKFKLPYSLKILGDGYRRIGELDLALNIYGIALNHYGDGVPFQEIRALLSSSIAQIEAEKKAIKEAEDFKEKLRKELIEEEEKQKKEIGDKMVQAKEKEQEISKSFMEENIKEVEEPVWLVTSH